jgi:hypothetical protein
MNRVQFSYPATGINITKVMVPPKNRTTTQNWLKAARKAIPQIPDIAIRTDWYIYEEIVTDNTIALHLRDSAGRKCALVIERKDHFSPR